jgi:hypothetical protein
LKFIFGIFIRENDLETSHENESCNVKMLHEIMKKLILFIMEQITLSSIDNVSKEFSLLLYHRIYVKKVSNIQEFIFEDIDRNQ